MKRMRHDVILGQLPDPFVMGDGRRVASLSDWAVRRQEILDSVIEMEFGGMPPAPEAVRYEMLCHGGAKSPYIYRVHCGTEAVPFSFCLSVFIPEHKGPRPVILTGDSMWNQNLDDRVLAEALRRGYAVAKFCRVEFAPDIYNSDRVSGIYNLYPDSHFCAISAWAWGYHRAVDVLVQLPWVDPAQIAITGHSRGGKAVLLAGATDERIAFVNPNGSGTHGGGCYRFEQREENGVSHDTASEPLQYLFDNVPYWMGPALRDYIGREAELPYDMHYVKMLIAPRYYLETNGYGDVWGNPRGAYLTFLAAKEAWRMYGEERKCATWYRLGGHLHRWDDFCALLDFMDSVRCGVPLPETIARIPYDDMEPLHDWRCPIVTQ